MGGSYRARAGDTFAMGDQGVLVTVERQEDHLALTIEHEGRTQSGILQWDAPPSLDDVEEVLQAHRGEPIRVIGDLEV